jgi:YfiR/HmsC-like
LKSERDIEQLLSGLRVRRRQLLCGLVAGALSSVVIGAWAESPTAPIAVQAQVLARILPFERGFAAHAKDRVLIIIVERNSSPDSASAARQMSRALSEIGKVADKPIVVRNVAFGGVGSLARDCKESGALALYVTPDLGAEVPALATALAGSRVLSLAAVEGYVRQGAVLGVEVVDGKPRMSINLAQAKAQKLDFPSALLKLARIY